MKNILIVEDDKSIVELVEIHLKDIHCHLTKANTGKDGLSYASKNKYDIIILDIMLPDIDGIRFANESALKKISHLL